MRFELGKTYYRVKDDGGIYSFIPVECHVWINLDNVIEYKYRDDDCRTVLKESNDNFEEMVFGSKQEALNAAHKLLDEKWSSDEL